MMKKYIPELKDITYKNPSSSAQEEVTQAYYAALRQAANLALDVSVYSRIVYDENCPLSTGADYIAEAFAWESAGYYWQAALERPFPLLPARPAWMLSPNGWEEATGNLVGRPTRPFTPC